MALKNSHDTIFDMNRYKQQRMNMVACQLQPMGIRAPWVLEAMGRVPREDFITDQSLCSVSYCDENLYSDQICVMPAPIVTAQILQSSNIQPGEDVLLKSNNPLYTHALIGNRCHVYTNEESLDLFDVIIYEANALEKLPEELMVKLKNGGRLLFVLHELNKCSKLVLVTRIDNSFTKTFEADIFLPFEKNQNATKDFEFYT